MSDTYILGCNALVYTAVACLYFFRTDRKITIGLFMLSLYAVIAWGGLLYRSHEYFGMFNDDTRPTSIPALVYLFVALMVFLYPFVKWRSSDIEKAQKPDERFFFGIIKITVAVQIVLLLSIFGDFMTALRASDVGALRDTMYDGNFTIGPKNYILGLIFRLYMGAKNVILVMSVYAFLFYKRSHILRIVFLILSFAFPLVVSTLQAGRDTMVFESFFALFLFILLSNFIKKVWKSRMAIVFGVIGFLVASGFAYISASRFDDLASYMFVRYLGEPMVNYETLLYPDIKGHTGGAAYFFFFSKLLGLGMPEFETTVEKWDYIESVTGVDGSVFYTMVGALNFEFGFIPTILIGIILSYIIVRFLKPYSVLTLPKFIVIGVYAHMMIRGGFNLYVQGEWGNLEILFTIFFAILFQYKQSNSYVYKLGYEAPLSPQNTIKRTQSRKPIL